MGRKVAFISVVLLAALSILFLLRQNSFQLGSLLKGASTPGGSRTQQQAGRPRIVTRNEWGAKDTTGKMISQTPDHITIHHTASRQRTDLSIEQKMRSLQDFSQSQSHLANGQVKKAWPDVPYHFYIGVDGRIAQGRDVNFVGDTNTDYDPTGHILIVLEGNFDQEQPSSAQMESLRSLVLWAASNWRVQANALKGHKDYAQTACPGMNLEKELPQLQKLITDAGDSKKQVER
jgi:hypothetical protein